MTRKRYSYLLRKPQKFGADLRHKRVNESAQHFPKQLEKYHNLNHI